MHCPARSSGCKSRGMHLKRFDLEQPDSINLELIKQQIKAEAQRLGFAACGVAAVGPVDTDIQSYFADWIASNRQAGMEYMKRYTVQRMNPALLWEGARSILCLALNYYPDTRIPEKELQLAYYAYGKDYHEVLKVKMRELLVFIRSLVPAEGRICVDTAPILERYWAQKAGLGWIGKNTLLILPKAGSFFFLGEIILDVYLPPDAPVYHQCGGCKRCIEACPSGALCAPFVLDAQKCLSYQTIENREALSPEAEEVLDNRIYGCDACQKACPHQCFSTPTRISAFRPSPGLLQMNREKWSRMTIEEYRTLFKGSAVKRVKYEGLQRNIRSAIRKK